MVTVGNMDVTLSFDRNDEVIVDGDTIACIGDKNIKKLFIITNNILKTIDHHKDNNQDIVNSSIIDFANNISFEFNSSRSNSLLINIIPEMSLLEDSVTYKNKIYKINRDNFGIITSIDDSEGIYEIASDDEDKSYFYSASLHKFINDNFDNGLIPTKGLYCLDVVESLDEDLFHIMRRIYKINKLEDFEKYISDNKDSKELVLDIITTGFLENNE